MCSGLFWGLFRGLFRGLFWDFMADVPLTASRRELYLPGPLQQALALLRGKPVMAARAGHVQFK